MTDAIRQIEATVQTYFDGLYEGDADKIASVFHPVSHLYVANGDEVTDLPREQWLKMVRERASAKSQNLERRDRIVSIDQSGPETAFVKVECQIPPRYFTDYLNLLKVGGKWCVVSKVFRADTRTK
jgi:hypothetical protein